MRDNRTGEKELGLGVTRKLFLVLGCLRLTGKKDTQGKENHQRYKVPSEDARAPIDDLTVACSDASRHSSQSEHNEFIVSATIIFNRLKESLLIPAHSKYVTSFPS